MKRKKLQSIRINQGLKLIDVSKATGLSKSYICDLEHGRRTGTYETMKILADYYGVTVG